jgi:hypothetical protein
MNRQLLTKIDLYVIGWGVVLVIGSAFFRELDVFLGAVAGASLAAINWLGFRYLGLRFAASGAKARFGIFLAVKTILVFAAITLLLLSKVVHPLAFMIGLSALVLGIITRSAIAAVLAGESALKEEP